MKKTLIQHTTLLFLLVLSCCLTACRKFLQVPPPINQLGSEMVFVNDANATAAVNGIYSEMIKSSQQFSSGMTTLYAGLSADELYYYTPGIRDEFLYNEITQANHDNLSNLFWAPAYRNIYAANLCIEKLALSTGVTPVLKNTLTGECKFLRAFNYFYLVNLFGAVPIVSTTDYEQNMKKARTPVGEIYDQIINDLKDAQGLLSQNYPTGAKTRVNKLAATALLARVYLYREEWAKAEEEATAVINSGIYSLENSPGGVFLKASKEAIFQLITTTTSVNTWEGNAILPASNAATPSFLLSNGLVNAFEAGDKRKAEWLLTRIFANDTLYYPGKYKVYGNNAPLSEYYVVLRLAEQYLIRAEARAQQNNINVASEDISIIRTRAGLGNTIAATKEELLEAIERERRTEFFAEWGHRWLDLKRTGRANAILGSLKGSAWQATDVLWPIPQDQINLNSSLLQNPGY